MFTVKPSSVLGFLFLPTWSAWIRFELEKQIHYDYYRIRGSLQKLELIQLWEELGR